MNLKTDDIEPDCCNFCGQEKLTYRVCEGCRDELLTFSTEPEFVITPEDYGGFMKTLYWSCNLFLGFLEQYDEYSIYPNKLLPEIKRDLNRIVIAYKPTERQRIDATLIKLIEDIGEKLNAMKRNEFKIKSDRQLFHVFPIIFMNFNFTLKFLSKIS